MAAWWMIIVAVVIVVCIYLEHVSQNYKDLGSKCLNATPDCLPADKRETVINKTLITLRKNHSLVSWRRALLVAFLLVVPLVYLLTKRLPSRYSFSITIFMLMAACYFGYIWLEYSTLYKNDQEIEDILHALWR